MVTPKNPSIPEDEHNQEKPKDAPSLEDFFDDFPSGKSGKTTDGRGTQGTFNHDDDGALDKIESASAEELLDEGEDIDIPGTATDDFLDDLFEKEGEQQGEGSAAQPEKKPDLLAQYQLAQPADKTVNGDRNAEIFADSETDVDLMKRVPSGLRGKHIGKFPVILFMGFVLAITLGLLYGGLSKKGAKPKQKVKTEKQSDSGKPTFSIRREFGEETLAAPAEPSKGLAKVDEDSSPSQTGNIHFDQAIRELVALKSENAQMIEELEKHNGDLAQEKREARIVAGEPTPPALVPSSGARLGTPTMTPEQAAVLQTAYEEFLSGMMEAYILALGADTPKPVPKTPSSGDTHGGGKVSSQTGDSDLGTTYPSDSELEKVLRDAGMLREQTGREPFSATGASVKGSSPISKIMSGQSDRKERGHLRRAVTTLEPISGDPMAPRTPFELKTGHIIPCILISGINSDLPGDIIAQVSHDVYDSASGNHLLIPVGSRLWGTYGSTIASGQNRATVIWSRIIFPDGSTVDLPGLQGVDKVGYTGFQDKVNRHILSTLGSVFLYSAFGALPVIIENEVVDDDDDDTNVNINVKSGTESQDSGASVNPTVIVNKEDDNSKSAGQVYAEETAKMLSDIGKQMIQKNINRAPTIKIRPGYIFNIFVNRDIVFERPYEKEKL